MNPIQRLLARFEAGEITSAALWEELVRFFREGPARYSGAELQSQVANVINQNDIAHDRPPSIVTPAGGIPRDAFYPGLKDESSSPAAATTTPDTPFVPGPDDPLYDPFGPQETTVYAPVPHDVTDADAAAAAAAAAAPGGTPQFVPGPDDPTYPLFVQPGDITPETYANFLDFTPAEEALAGIGEARGGRQNIFSAFIGGLPGVRQVAPALQQALSRQFNPLSAQFNLQQARLAPIGGMPGGQSALQNFRSFLQSGPQRFDQAQWQAALNPLREAYAAQIPTVQQDRLIQAFKEQEVQNNLMATVMNLGVNPYMQRFTPGVIQRQRTQQIDLDPTIDPFQQWLNPQTAVAP
jgi:hypothetical protein